MYFGDSLLSAASLAMDAFAVSMCIGAGTPGVTRWTGIRMGLVCGAFQFIMPLVGWFIGEYALAYVEAFDHWIAFALLAFVGGNMIRGSFGDEDTAAYPTDPTKTWAILYLALATSIDALAVGASFAMTHRPVMLLATAAGVITAALCFAGMVIGGIAGSKLGKRVEFAGGLVLVLIGLNILREHLL